MKNVYVMTATQDQQIGYALDSKWYGIPEYTKYMRSALQKLTRDDVNRAIKEAPLGEGRVRGDHHERRGSAARRSRCRRVLTNQVRRRQTG